MEDKYYNRKNGSNNDLNDSYYYEGYGFDTSYSDNTNPENQNYDEQANKNQAYVSENYDQNAYSWQNYNPQNYAQQSYVQSGNNPQSYEKQNYLKQTYSKKSKKKNEKSYGEQNFESPADSSDSAAAGDAKAAAERSKEKKHEIVPAETPVTVVHSVVPQPAPSPQNDEIEIDLVELFYVLWEKIGMIIFCAVIGAVIAFAYTYFLVTPLYTATAKMYILSSSSNSVVNLSDLQISSSLRSDYQELLTSRPLMEKVIDSLGLEYSYEELRNKVKISNPKDTRILNVTVTTPSAQLSADIANMLVLQGQQDLPQIMKSEEPSIFENAIVPTQKSSPSFLKNTVIGAMLLTFLYCAFVIFRYVTNDTLVTPDDVYRAFGVQPLATIPEGDLSNFYKKGREIEKTKKKKRKQEEKRNRK